MHKFDYYGVPRIVFGRGQFARAGELAAGLGGPAFFISSPGGAGGGALERLREMLAAAGVRSAGLPHRGEPTISAVDRLTEAARREGANLLIAIGGGSVIDSAKAVSGLLTNGGSAQDYMETVGAGRKVAKPGIPWIAIPTTAGTGAEVTRNAVVASPQKHFKASIRSEHLLARVALVDPDLSAGAPPEVTAATGMDALSQLIESYTSTGAEPMTDALARAGIPLAARCLPRAYRDGGDLEAREGMALAALWSGICLTNTSLGAVHGIAAPLGACIPAPHGAICAALLSPVIAANVRALRAQSSGHPALARYADIGRAMAEDPALPDAQAIAACIERTGRLAREVGVTSLGRFGLTREIIPGVATLACRSNSIRANPVKLSEEALAAAMVAAL